MNTLEELKYYCEEKEPVGAILLTGEWGCGKTYLIENELKEKVKDFAIVLRVSLFGISTVEEIHTAVKNAWIEKFFESKSSEKVVQKTKGIAKKVNQGWGIIKKFQFVPNYFKHIVSVDILSLISVKSKIGEKPIILVFDDLERCFVKTIDILGTINEYCENKKIHTIIVANEDKIKEKNQSATENKETFDFSEIKEKIVQRTIAYEPQYETIVSSIIENMKHKNDKYIEFIQTNKDAVLELFAPDRNEKIPERKDDFDNLFKYAGTSDDRTQNNDKDRLDENIKRPHNLRSLKCALNDFYRVYEILIKNGFDDIDRWLNTFISYVIAYKADITQLDVNIKILYPAFNKSYIFKSVKNWISKGVWDEAWIENEIEWINNLKLAKKPSQIIKYSRINTLDENIIQQGFSEYLEMAYNGSLTLDEYIRLIQNCAWARNNKYEFPEDIEWRRVQRGIKIRIEKIEEELPENQLFYSLISENEKHYYSTKEWETYEIISNFTADDIFMFYKNRKDFINEIKKSKSSILYVIQNKRFDIFDKEMAKATADAFIEDDTAGKSTFALSFTEMWKYSAFNRDLNFSDSISGFEKLRSLLENYLEGRKEKKRTFALIHTENFINKIDELIESYKAIEEGNDK